MTRRLLLFLAIAILSLGGKAIEPKNPEPPILGFSPLFIFNTYWQPIEGYSGLFVFNTLEEPITGYSPLFLFNTLEEPIIAYSGLFLFNTLEEPIIAYSGLFAFNTLTEPLIGYSGLFVFNTMQSPEEYQLSVLISPHDAGEVSGAGQYAQGDPVSLTATAFGNYLFKSWNDESGGILSEDNPYTFDMPGHDLQLTALFQLNVSLSEAPDEGIRVYPNPASDRIQISTTEAVRRILITDMQARTLIQSDAEGNHAEISMAHLPEGMYIVQLIFSEGTQSQRIIIIQR